MPPLRVVLAQINVVVGDVAGNLARIRAALAEAESASPDIVAFPELALSGYPPEDLLLRPSFLADVREALDSLAADVGEAVVVVGFPERAGPPGTRDVYNAAAIVRHGRVRDIYRKRHLPNYGVFDEERYFEPGDRVPVYRLGEDTFAVNICEDIWVPGEPLSLQARVGRAGLAINISASPFHAGKGHDRERMIAARAGENGIAVGYCNLVGGQDELVFDGQSLLFDAGGALIARAAPFAEDLLVADLADVVDPADVADAGEPATPAEGTERVDLGPRRDGRDCPPVAPRITPHLPSRPAEILAALTLGLGDYFRKNGFAEACVGLSGGIDSAVTAAVAVRALGAGRVYGFYLPSRYSSEASRSGARALCASLGIRFEEIPIEGIFTECLATLEPVFEGAAADETEENLQARIRGNLLMALSNKFGWLVLAPGNKSELSVGYCTLYGDMVGGFAVLKDLLKTDVFAVAREINREAGREVIPRATIERAPTAELRHDQLDTDALPRYDLLDPILEAYIERDMGREEIVALGYPEDTVGWVLDAVDRSEYKRRQAPPGIKITTRAFGKDRRMPITNRYRGRSRPGRRASR